MANKKNTTATENKEVKRTPHARKASVKIEIGVHTKTLKSGATKDIPKVTMPWVTKESWAVLKDLAYDMRGCACKTDGNFSEWHFSKQENAIAFKTIVTEMFAKKKLVACDKPTKKQAAKQDVNDVQKLVESLVAKAMAKYLK